VQLVSFEENIYLDRPVEQQLANMECNATSAVAITHHFVEKLVSDAMKHCCHVCLGRETKG
jgi:hypothetical protein